MSPAWKCPRNPSAGMSSNWVIVHEESEMKKPTRLVIVILASLAACFFGGCVSDDEFAALEARVTQLEEENRRSGTGDSAVNREENNSVEAEESSEEIYTYVIDGYSKEELLNECEYYFDNVPMSIASLEEFYSIMKCPPAIKDEGTLSAIFSTDEKDIWFNNFTDKSVITSIKYLGTQNMDGTIGYINAQSNNDLLGYYGVEINMILQDYEKAEFLYSSIREEVLANESVKTLYESEEGTTWSFYTSTYPLEVQVLNMAKQDNGYHLMIRYYKYVF